MTYIKTKVVFADGHECSIGGENVTPAVKLIDGQKISGIEININLTTQRDIEEFHQLFNQKSFKDFLQVANLSIKR